MSKHETQMREIMRSQKAAHDFLVSGKLPQTTTPCSPLISYLERIPPRERAVPRLVKLHPKLGYESVASFSSLQQMLNYLKPSNQVIGSWPAESRRNKRFNSQITDELFNKINPKKIKD
ncbi:hypothetical protein A3715_10640 [Oleiphilus sp. HI0009]|nr:hypothetical protein A3715_10640 [Oleiphilus sp. HI0009]